MKKFGFIMALCVATSLVTSCSNKDEEDVVITEPSEPETPNNNQPAKNGGCTIEAFTDGGELEFDDNSYIASDEEARKEEEARKQQEAEEEEKEEDNKETENNDTQEDDNEGKIVIIFSGDTGD
ncbi:MAG: hypothetical protein IKQ46_16360 [Bacteroidales bacterium]|jgi:hypothetical protein|nr:hypothetical protein [Bacteroidales bacterium]